MIAYNIIATGSDGNAVIINDDILIDCGVAYKALADYVQRLKIVFLTHIHGDHFNKSTIKRLAFERPALRFAAAPWLITPLYSLGVLPQNIDMLKPGNVYAFNSCKVIPFELRHDVQNVGYKMLTSAGRLIYATDTRNLDGVKAENYDLYLIEGNYDSNEIQERIADKKVDGVYSYERRVIDTHMSRQTAESWLYQNMGAHSQYVLMHQHKGV